MTRLAGLVIIVALLGGSGLRSRRLPEKGSLMLRNKDEVEVIPYGIGLHRVRELQNGRAKPLDINETTQYFNYIDDLRSEMPEEEFAAKWHEYMDVSPEMAVWLCKLIRESHGASMDLAPESSQRSMSRK